MNIHSERGSLLDGAIKVPEISARAAELGMSSIAVTDHGSLAAVLNHFVECKKNNVKFIAGIESYLTLDQDNITNEMRTRDNYHMILIAKNETGWKNLMKLQSMAYLNNFYYKPRIFIDNLADYSEGLIGSSACLASLCSRSATYDEINNKYWDPEHKVEDYINQFGEIFRGEFYLELMDNSMPQQKAYNEFLIHMAKKTGYDLVITSDAHYTKKEDEELHTLLMALQSKKSIEEYKKDNYFHYENCYIRSPAEMLAAAKKIGVEEAFHNTIKVSEQVNLEFELDKYKLPLYDITADKDYKEYCQHA